MTGKGAKKLELVTERTYFLGNRVERGSWPASSKADSRMARGAPTAGCCLCRLLNGRTDDGAQGCASVTVELIHAPWPKRAAVLISRARILLDSMLM